MKKNKDDILASLEANLPKEEIVPVAEEKPEKNQQLKAEAEEDYEFARENIRKLINTSIDAVDLMHNLTIDSEHPRAGEVLGNLIKQSADMNNQLLQLNKQRKELVIDDSENNKSVGNTTNNSIFVGTTAELQKLLKQNTTIDIEE